MSGADEYALWVGTSPGGSDLVQAYPTGTSATATVLPRAAGTVFVRLRRPLVSDVPRLKVKGISDGSQPLVLWHNRQLAGRHRSYADDPAADLRKLVGQGQSQLEL